ncbi:hypothetical protein GCM10025858_08990 [Alicyclobacillus sacchari]|uniref:hypothetical protein n=1 Tax=Alicyclobacillus sacchari TaxID=392010 RepID=UPI0023E91038|nr:hypothetical protein [Alicyclobacillus sacchari]GMA56396.1 hypothetical protein GCM10025858_08990 [Alicyclobacillus sacchari]
MEDFSEPLARTAGPPRTQHRGWRVAYMMFFAVYATIANLDTSASAAWIAWGYILLSVFALPVVLPHFRRSLFRTWDPLRSRLYAGKRATLLTWRLYIYILTPIAFIALLELFSILESVFLQFTQSNVSTKVGVMDYIIALLAGLEELWRWSMIGTVVIVCRWLAGDRWRHGQVRAMAFAIAVILSSLSFGASHSRIHARSLAGLVFIQWSGLAFGVDGDCHWANSVDHGRT